MTHLNTGMCSSRRDLLSPSTRPPLSAAFYHLFKQNPVLGLTCIRPRCLSRSIFIAMSLGMPFPNAGVWAALLVGTEEWNQGVRFGNTEGRHRNTPCFIQYASWDHPEVLMWTGRVSWQRASGSRKSLLEQLPYFSTQVPSALEAAVSANFLAPSKWFISGWSKVCAAQIWASSSA